jgi:dihydrofolate reductase
MERFKQLTLNHPVIMGRKTFESIVARLGKPLPKRENVILTRDRAYHPRGATSIGESGLLYYLKRAEKEDVFVIGGGEIYSLTLPITKRIWLTLIDTTIQGDTLYPELSEDMWFTIKGERNPADEENEYPYTYMEYVRKT